MLGRLASAEVRNGVAYLNNMIPDPRGPVISRQGFEHIATITSTANRATIIGMELYEGKSLIFALHDDKCSVYNATTKQFIKTVTTPYTDVLLHGANGDEHNVSVFISPGADQIYFLHPSVAPWGGPVSDTSPAYDNTLTFGPATVSFTGTPSEWTGDNYPTCMTWFQDRTWWAGCKDDPETFWGSKTGDHEDMTLGATDSDGVSYELQHGGLIRWLSGYRTLLIGTEFAEHIATASNNGPITPSDIQIEIQSAYGSTGIQPEFIGDEVIYVSPDRRKVRAMYYKLLDSGWKSQDVTFTGEHLTYDQIKDIAYSRDPYSMIYILTKEDDLVVCSYRNPVNQEQIVGWSRITPAAEITKITGITTVADYGTSSVVIAAQTLEDGSPALHIMQQRMDDIYENDLVVLDNCYASTPIVDDTPESADWTLETGWDEATGGGVWTVDGTQVAPSRMLLDAYLTEGRKYKLIFDVGVTYAPVETPAVYNGTSLLGNVEDEATNSYEFVADDDFLSISAFPSVTTTISNLILYDLETGGRLVVGLSHLKGHTVKLICDGTIKDDIYITGDTYTVDDDYTQVAIGHDYTQQMNTMPFILLENAMAHQMKRWNKIYVALLNSYPPLIDDVRVPDREVSTPMGTTGNEITGLVTASAIGWDRYGSLEIKQNIAKSMIITGIYGEIAVKGV